MVDAVCVINGHPVVGEARGTVHNPARITETVGTYPILGQAEVEAAVEAARTALPGWSALGAVERADMLRAAATGLAGLELDTTLVRETGKARWEAQAEAAAVDLLVDLFGSMAASLEEPELLHADENGTVRLYREPVGVVGATIAWNSPVWLAAGKLIPALLAGNTVIVKPSPVAPLATLELVRELARKLPQGVLNSVSGEDLVVGSALFSHPGVNMTSFTGGIGGGRAAATAGASTFTRMLLELGGNDAAVLLDDQPITDALCAELATSAFILSGQMCVGLKRIYAPQSKVAELAEGIHAFLDTYVVGDGLDPDTTIGPVTTESQYKRVSGLVESARAANGEVRCAGRLALSEGSGYFLLPSVVTGLAEEHPLVKEEQFGPALPIQGYTSLGDAIAKANGTEYGLTGSIWSPDVEHATSLARRLEAGSVTINVHGFFGVNLVAPYGGVKLSGLGREYGRIGFEAYTEPKVVSTWRVRPQPSSRDMEVSP